MAKKKAKTYTGENVAYIAAMLGKRSSNAAGKHADRRTRRARTREARNLKAVKDQE